MAKKKQELTVEEKLAAALVREDEQPYEVPGNWVWTRVDSINQYNSATINPLKNSLELFELYSVPSCENDYPEILLGSEIGSTKQIVQKNDVLLCKINPRINRVWIVKRHTENMQIASSEWIVVRNSTIIPKYLLWYFRSNGFRKQLLTNVSGVGGSLMRAQPKYVKTYAIPLPPLAEQQRIVDRIESLFDQLDQAKALIQEALDSFATRKAAILHQAFTGALTKKWREAHGVGLESWEEKKISEICDIVRGGSPRPAGDPLYYDGEIPFLKVADITHSEDMYIRSFKYSIKEAGLKKTRLVEPDTLLLTNSGATLGVPGITSFKTTFNDGIAAFLGLEKDSLKFFYYFWTSKTLELRGINKGAAQPNLNTEIIGNVVISLPSVPEQHEIANILDDLFAKEQAAFDLCDQIDPIDTIKKTILGKAFRGELGTNVVGEESAVALLKQVLQGKEKWL